LAARLFWAPRAIGRPFEFFGFGPLP